MSERQGDDPLGRRADDRFYVQHDLDWFVGGLCLGWRGRGRGQRKQTSGDGGENTCGN